MTKNNFFYKMKNDTVFRNRFTLTFSFVWGALLTLYYFLIGYYSYIQTETWSWFLSLTVWYCVIAVFKLLLMINAFKLKNEKWIDFKLITIIYLSINFAEVLIITTSPSLFVQTFGSKLHKSISVSSLIVSNVNLFIFILNWLTVKRSEYSRNEADFLTSKKYIGRTEGLFNILLIIINILIICNVNETIIGYVYLVVGLVFAGISLVLLIKLVKKRKWDKTHKRQ